MSKFKIGDKVRVCVGWYAGIPKGTILSVVADGTLGAYWIAGGYAEVGTVNVYHCGFELVEAAQESNETASLVQKTTPKNDDSSEEDSLPADCCVSGNNAWFERGELPEIGTVCEYRHNFTGNWNEGEVVAQLGSEVVICDHNWHTSHWLTLDKLRPIKKTAEEIETEARKKAVGAVEEQILEQMGELNVRNLAEHIVDTFDLRFTKEGK